MAVPIDLPESRQCRRMPVCTAWMCTWRAIMRILLAIDDSECSTAAVKAVIDQFRPAHTQITVLHADDWPEGMPPPMAFAEGSSAARSVLAFHKLRRSNA